MLGWFVLCGGRGEETFVLWERCQLTVCTDTLVHGTMFTHVHKYMHIQYAHTFTMHAHVCIYTYDITVHVHAETHIYKSDPKNLHRGSCIPTTS